MEKSGDLFCLAVVSRACSHPSRRFFYGSLVGLAVARNWSLRSLRSAIKLAVLRRQRPGRTRLFALDRLLWIWLYRVWPGAGLTTGTFRVPPAAYIQLSMGEARSPEHKF
jgi:hypothetical protein